MIKEITTDRERINRNYPFMINFPFNNDFDMKISSSKTAAIELDEEYNPTFMEKSNDVIDFKYRQDPMNAIIYMHRQDLIWISEIADQVEDLDRMSKRLDDGLRSEDIILKREVSVETDEWLARISDGTNSISRETFSEVLQNLIGGRSTSTISRLINNLNKLQSGKGIVKLSRSDFRVILTYFHFKLIYTKLILGVVIASKISI
jgi:hypothetical protein